MAKTTQKLVFITENGAESGLHMAAVMDETLNVETVDGKETVKTTWYPGDSIYFLVQVDPGLRIADVRASWGNVQLMGTVRRQHTDDVTVIEPPAEDKAEASSELSYIPAGQVTLRWYGNAPTLRQDGRSLYYTDGALPAVGRADYQSTWQSYRLVPRPLELEGDAEWPGVIAIYVEQLDG